MLLPDPKAISAVPAIGLTLDALLGKYRLRLRRMIGDRTKIVGITSGLQGLQLLTSGDFDHHSVPWLL
jgi:hypothetical protein